MPSPDLRRPLRATHVAGLLIHGRQRFKETTSQNKHHTPVEFGGSVLRELGVGMCHSDLCRRFAAFTDHLITASRADDINYPTRGGKGIRRRLYGTWRIGACPDRRHKKCTTPPTCTAVGYLTWFRAGFFLLCCHVD